MERMQNHILAQYFKGLLESQGKNAKLIYFSLIKNGKLQ